MNFFDWFDTLMADDLRFLFFLGMVTFGCLFAWVMFENSALRDVNRRLHKRANAR